MSIDPSSHVYHPETPSSSDVPSPSESPQSDQPSLTQFPGIESPKSPASVQSKSNSSSGLDVPAPIPLKSP